MAVFLSLSTIPSLLSSKTSPSREYTAVGLTTTCPFLSVLSRKNKRGCSVVCLSVKGQSKTQKTEVVVNGKSLGKGGGKVVLSEGRDVDEGNVLVCPGCGVYMQDRDANVLGFFKKRIVDDEIEGELQGLVLEDDDDFGEEEGEEQEDRVDKIEGSLELSDDEEGDLETEDEDEDEDEDDWDEEEWDEELDGEEEDEDEDLVGFAPAGAGYGDNTEEILNEKEGKKKKVSKSDSERKKLDREAWDTEEWDEEFDGEEEDEDEELVGFSPAGVGYGNNTEEVMNEKEDKKKKVSKSERKKLAREAHREREGEEVVTVCARCHSLRNYGQVKNQTAENLIPDFDFDRLISTRLMKPTTADSTVVVMVVDCVDFDGSFPKRAARSLFKALGGNLDAKLSKKLPKLVLVATKIDLLPSQVSPTRLDRWVRHRARALGAPKLNAVYMVSSRKDLGVRNLLSYIKELAGPRGHVWVIGAQNAGKSTLINTFSKKEGAKITKLTEAAVPGTTLGILRVGGILSGKAKMYDTPGLLHPYLMSMRLTREEQKMIEIRKELRPRTYRIKAGQTVHVGGLIRLDLVEASVQTIYVTVWASASVSLHLGKLENAEETWRKHAGIRLQPPIGTDQLSEMENWKEREFKITGTSWDVNSWDLAVAGLGWLSLGLKGQATLKLRTYDSVEVALREPLVLDRASFLERPGFWLPQAISDALGNQNKLEAQKKKQQELEEEESGTLVDITA